jgi:acyl-CoA thioester hydrolase
VYLRYLAQAAVEASAAAGFGPAWYAAAGAVWLVRRSTLTIHDPIRGGERLAIRTWVEDFRRVRSHRRYDVRDRGERQVLEGRTDWVYVDAVTGKPRRVPQEVERALGDAATVAQERPGWEAPPPPPAPARSLHRVRLHDLDSLAHVNNAVYLDLVAQATHDALAAHGWSLDRMLGEGGAPTLADADLEYLSGARYGDEIEIFTWFAAGSDVLEAHHRLALAAEPRPIVQATTRWRWTEPATGARVRLPAALVAAIRPLLAA